MWHAECHGRLIAVIRRAAARLQVNESIDRTKELVSVETARKLKGDLESNIVVRGGGRRRQILHTGTPESACAQRRLTDAARRCYRPQDHGVITGAAFTAGQAALDLGRGSVGVAAGAAFGTGRALSNATFGTGIL